MESFQGFFSYAHLDAEADPKLLEALTNVLELRVRAKLANAEFSIWRDVEGLRVGERWSPAIERAIRTSHLMILLLSPKWVQSDFCRREYQTFTEIEASKPIGEYVAPIVVREIAGQKSTLHKSRIELWLI